MMKKVTSILVVICLIIVSSNFTYAKSKDINEVEILKELNILRGNGISLDLDSQLSRSEAAAFIVRLLCVDEEVKDNSYKYTDTDFTDVESGEWYAPYIGYCAQNDIINGYPGNIFKPKDKLGEKAFLKLVLTAIGYEYEEDFTWNNVFEKAYGVGLVTDSDYINSNYVEDKNFTRGEVCEILYTALQLVRPDTNVRVIQQFIDDSLISKEDAVEYKLINDKVETEIESITTVNANTIEVTFNEKLKQIDEEDILIYDQNDSAIELSVEDISEKEDDEYTYIIKTEQKQKIDIEYVLLIDEVIDAKGNPSSVLDGDFIGYRADELVSDFFRISKIEPVSNNIINVYYTQPINENALQSSYYRILQDDEEIIVGDNMNMQVNKLSTCNNGVSIFLKNYIFPEEELLQIEIDGNLSSIYGVNLNDGEGDSIKFKSMATENDPFTVDDCEAINSKTVQVNFNKAVSPVLAKQIYSYYVTDNNDTPIQVIKADVIEEGDYAGKSVRLTLNTSLRHNEEYNIMINNMLDVTRQFSIIEKSFDFMGGYYETEDIEIDFVESIDSKTLEVGFSEMLDEEYTRKINNYTVKELKSSRYIKPKAVYYNKEEDPYMVKIYLEKELKESKEYSFRAITLKDSWGNIHRNIKSYSFEHYEDEVVDIYIDNAIIIGSNTIKLAFNKEIAFDINNVLISNYILSYIDNGVEYDKVPISANYINPTTIILKFDMLDSEIDYKLTFKKLIDYGNNETDNKDGTHSVDVTLGQ